ncbi:MAG: hypothetical protein ACLVJ6_11910 [Merdibacter sp.]
MALAAMGIHAFSMTGSAQQEDVMRQAMRKSHELGTMIVAPPRTCAIANRMPACMRAMRPPSLGHPANVSGSSWSAICIW